MATKTTKTTKKVNVDKAVAPAANLSADIFNVQGKKSGVLQLPANIFGLSWNESLMHQVVTSMQDNARTNVAHARGRGDVRGGGRKPWKQKGTGRARHSSIRSPIWRGGGVTHGPNKDENFSRTIPKKMRAKALFIALSRKLRDGEIVFVHSFEIEKPSTASAKKALVALSKSGFDRLNKDKNAALVAFSDAKEASVKSFRNLGNVSYASVRDLNPVSVLRAKYLILENPEAAVAILATRAASKNSPRT
jgi:large subunit ribosomal protein L4